MCTLQMDWLLGSVLMFYFGNDYGKSASVKGANANVSHAMISRGNILVSLSCLRNVT